MSTLVALLLATASSGVWSQDPSGSAAPGTERVVLQKDGGPGHGPDQPYSVREQGAADLEGFVGGKQVVFVAPYDVFLLALVIALVVVLVILL